jgi:hypothetical protein
MRVVLTLSAVVIWFSCAVSAGQLLTDADSLNYDVESDFVLHSIHQGMTIADGGYSLEINGVPYIPAQITLDGRNITETPQFLSCLQVSRSLFVPGIKSANLGNFGRWFDVLANPTDIPITVSIAYRTNLGFDSSTQIVSTSDGDQGVELNDTWVATDDSFGGAGDTSLAHLIGTENAPETIDHISIFTDEHYWHYDAVTILPHETVDFLTYVVQEQNQALALEEVEGILNSLLDPVTDNIAYTNLQAEEVRIANVPEPASVALMALACLSFLHLRRPKRNR